MESQSILVDPHIRQKAEILASADLQQAYRSKLELRARQARDRAEALEAELQVLFQPAGPPAPAGLAGPAGRP